MRPVLHVIVACVVGACSRGEAGVIERVTPPPGVEVRRLRVDAADAEGLSGAALGAGGELWVVAERQRRLLRMEVKDDALVMKGAPIALDGLPAELETESLAWLGDNRVLLGTETGNARAHDLLLLMTIEGAHAIVSRRIAVDYRSLGVAVDDNHGIEGVCAVGDLAVLALEQRRVDGTANLVLHDLALGQWQTRRLRLTTPTGKIASLDCGDVGPDGSIELTAIERHYGVGRVLAFRLDPKRDSGAPITPRVMIDVAQVVSPLPNFESVVLKGDDVIVITDNHHGGVTGPTQALRFRGLTRAADQKR